MEMNVREIFVKGAWSFIVSDEGEKGDCLETNGSGNWDNEEIKEIVQRMIKAGIDVIDIKRFAKIMQFQLLSSICYYLEDPEIYELSKQSKCQWGLFSTNEAGEPGEQLTGLHEIVLAHDPAGRKMKKKE